ncbi:type IV pilin protein [Synechococcus sp. UW179A]|uniref:type IV pilin protein n=1 Tax=Synechococcus sp. UW179A TaxID=2575510 RepID=UPI000E0EDFC1|nr:prepilin-type N-terminal cleavage/methylation domain-containing protein [Synechococcus sp. UW179A]
MNHTRNSANFAASGFSLTEMMVAVATIGILASIAIPSQIQQLCRAETNEAITTITSLQSIISGYTDETGSFASNWDDLVSISAIMTNNGVASGDFSNNQITLPSGIYNISINGPTDAVYNINGTRIDGCPNRDIKSCLNISTGASALNTGDGETNAVDVVCT